MSTSIPPIPVSALSDVHVYLFGVYEVYFDARHDVLTLILPNTQLAVCTLKLRHTIQNIASALPTQKRLVGYMQLIVILLIKTHGEWVLVAFASSVCV